VSWRWGSASAPGRIAGGCALRTPAEARACPAFPLAERRVAVGAAADPGAPTSSCPLSLRQALLRGGHSARQACGVETWAPPRRGEGLSAWGLLRIGTSIAAGSQVPCSVLSTSHHATRGRRSGVARTGVPAGARSVHADLSAFVLAHHQGRHRANATGKPPRSPCHDRGQAWSMLGHEYWNCGWHCSRNAGCSAMPRHVVRMPWPSGGHRSKLVRTNPFCVAAQG
jgi:hypothetical protein